MQVVTALLADFVSVREGLLFVVGGGVTRVYRDEFPAPMGVMLALQVELRRNEMQRPHELQIDIIDTDGAMIAQLQGGFQMEAGPDHEIQEPGVVSAVLDLRGVGLPHPGWYTVNILVNGESRRELGFRVGPRPAAGALPGS